MEEMEKEDRVTKMEGEDRVTKSPSLTEMVRPDTYAFSECIETLLNGGSVRRLSWEDKRVRVAIRNDQLTIWKADDNRFHPLIVSAGDLEGTDWVLTGNQKS